MPTVNSPNLKVSGPCRNLDFRIWSSLNKCCVQIQNACSFVARRWRRTPFYSQENNGVQGRQDLRKLGDVMTDEGKL